VAAPGGVDVRERAGRLPAGPVRTVGRELVPHVGHRHDPRLERDLVAPQALRVTAAVVYSPLDPENIVISDGASADTFYLSDTRDVGAGKVMLIGNYENDDFLDILWYGPGTSHDELWYGHNPDLANISVRSRGEKR
jgi:hypothetical protein